MPSSSAFKLSVIVPVGSLSGNIAQLESWVVDDKKVQIILILDNPDAETRLAIRGSAVVNAVGSIEMYDVNFGNPGEARNFGMSKARGEWITFTDADDHLYLCELIKIIESTQVIGKNLIVGNYERFDEALNRGSPVECSDLADVLDSLPSGLGLWRFSFRNEFLKAKEVKFPPLSMAEDQIFYLSLQPSEEEICFVNKILYRYCVGGDCQLTGNPVKVSDLQKAIIITLNQVDPRNWKYFDFLSAQIFSLILNKAEMTVSDKFRYVFERLTDIARKFGLSGLVRFGTYPVRRRH